MHFLPHGFAKIQIEIFSKEISAFFGSILLFRLLAARCKQVTLRNKFVIVLRATYKY